ncbi:MAG: ABC transporter ATP-binding protein [Thermofilaceae archaeon]
MEVVVAENLTKRFGFTVALKGVNLKLRPGLHLLLGPNGSGKTTFLKLVVGMLKPSSGRIRVLGLDPWRDYVKLSERVSFAFEGLPLPWWVTGREFLRALASMRGGASRLNEAADLLGVSSYWGKLPFTYSSGMAKRLILLTALAFDAQLYVLDEPFTLLDRETVNAVVGECARLVEEGRTLLVATHYIPPGLSGVAESLIRFEGGEVVEVLQGEEARTRLEAVQLKG